MHCETAIMIPSRAATALARSASLAKTAPKALGAAPMQVHGKVRPPHAAAAAVCHAPVLAGLSVWLSHCCVHRASPWRGVWPLATRARCCLPCPCDGHLLRPSRPLLLRVCVQRTRMERVGPPMRSGFSGVKATVFGAYGFTGRYVVSMLGAWCAATTAGHCLRMPPQRRRGAHAQGARAL